MNIDALLGQIAFEAYCKSVGGKTFDGKDIPGWYSDTMTDKVRKGWIDAAHAIISIKEYEARTDFLEG